jgi:hypothetical protein
MKDLDDFGDELVSVRALDLISAIADPQNAKARIADLAAVTAEYVAQRKAAEQAIADAEPARIAAEELDRRTTDFQTWTNSQEARFRKREAEARNFEELLAARQAELERAEADLARRVSRHDAAVADLKQRLAS